MLIQAALNGGRSPREHPALPVAPQQLAGDAAACAGAGAGAVHLHVRGADGRESLAADDVARTLAAVRERAPGLPVGVSTGAWIVTDPGERLRLVGAWETLPDYASVNVREAGAVALMELLLARGIGVEAGVWTAEDAELLAGSGLAERCLRVMLEPMEAETGAALENVERIEAVLAGAGIRAPRLLHGVNATAWPVLRSALARGWDTRVGLEDALLLPDGTPASGNAALVAAAVRLASELPSARRSD
jgi:uncharacterized protein (DUF849 family)